MATLLWHLIASLFTDVTRLLTDQSEWHYANRETPRGNNSDWGEIDFLNNNSLILYSPFLGARKPESLEENYV